MILKSISSKKLFYQFRYGKSFLLSNLKIICLPRNVIECNDNYLHYAIKITKKVSKSAVIRNKARRRIKHILMIYVNKYPYIKDFLLLIIIRNITSFSELTASFNILISQILDNSQQN